MLAVFCCLPRAAIRCLTAGVLLFALPVWGGSAFFNFNSNPTTSGLLTLYGNASWQPTGGAGSATNASDGYLQVTPSAGNQRGAIVFADFDNGQMIKAFTFEADVRIGNGTTSPADGFSINYVRANDPVLLDIGRGGNPAADPNIWATGPNCEPNLPEEGTQTGISVGFDAWDSGNQPGVPPYCNVADQSIGPDVAGVDIRVDGILVLQYPTPTRNGACDDPSSIQTGPTDGTGTPNGLCWAHVKVVLDTNALLNVYWKNTLILSNYQTTYKASPGQLVFAGRTGGAWEYHHVDNIAVTTIAAPVQPVNVTNSPATGIQTTSATLGGGVVATGGNLGTVTLFYGPTDQGTNAGAWPNRIYLGLQGGAFSNTVTGLAFNTKYYYTSQATNSGGIRWASPSLSFTTLAPAPATITNLSAAGVTTTSATLGGQVLSTGGDVPDVTLFYGPSDGGTTPSAWANSIDLGLQPGFFGQPVSGLISNQTYYFTSRAVNGGGTSWASPSLSFMTPSSNPPPPLSVAVLTHHNDNTRQGVNANETILKPANVNTNSFGRLFSYTVDGFVYAQPLIMTNVSIPGKGTHNVLYIATEHNSLYAFDADDNSGANASPLWQVSFLGTGVTTVPYGDTGTTDITPEVGITSTPVIDPVTGTIYVEVKTKENGNYVHRLHALDIATGLERTSFNSPSVIQCNNYPGMGTGDNDGQNPPHVLWNPLKEHCRPALTLLNGAVYMSFASHGDNTPYHGWMFAYNATNVAQQLGAYNATPNGGLGGFWDGGGGPTVDTDGNLYFQTGNGSFDGDTTVTKTNNYSMSLLKLATTNGITLLDYFAPNNAQALSDGDQDLGSSAPIILPDSAGSTAHRHLVVGGGKTAAIYLVDRENMGRFNGVNNPNNIVQQFDGGPGGDRDVTPAFFNNTLYIIDSNSRIGAYTITNAQFNTTPVESPDGYDNKGGATVSISANGTSNAIAWAIYNAGGQSPATPCILRAYNAANLSQKLYSSDQIASRDSAGDAVKFTVPTIANGKVYVGAQYSVTVYGLAAGFLNTPVISPNGGIFTNSVLVSITDSSPGTTIYYTLDGTVPATNSLLYAGPFTLTNSAVVQAFAVKPGSVSSGVASAGFINSSAVGNGTGLKGEYWSNEFVNSPPTDPFNGPPTLTRVDPIVDFDWGNGSPDASISADLFTARWTGSIQPQFTETYTFYVTSDDGARLFLWVNGQQVTVVDSWMDQAATEHSGTVSLLAGQRYNIEVDYYENGGLAVASNLWSSQSMQKSIIPTTQLYPVTNPPPVAQLSAPADGASSEAGASITLSANAGALYNAVKEVDFYANSTFLGAVSNAPYTLTTTGLGQGSYSLTAVALDTTGLAGTSAPVNITVTAGTGQPYGIGARAPLSPFLNMPTTINGALPPLLSQTGVFTNTAAMGPLNGLIPYDVNVPLWSDGAVKTRWMAVPNTGAPYTPDEQVGFAPTGEWTFPMGTIFVKHFDLITDLSNPNAPKRRLETRLLVRDPSGAVYGVTYKWRPDNSEADLLSTSLSEAITITNADHTTWTQTWYYPSPADCLACHTPAANYVLGVKTRQLNKDFTYPSSVTDNQLRTLNHAGLFNPAFSEASISGYDHLSALTNSAASLEERARSYLDANCAQCHRPGGPGVTIDARYDTPLANQNIINTLLIKGDLGIDNARVVVPKDIWRSVLYARMNTDDSTIKMPSLARNLVDTNAVQVMGDWINSLQGTPALAPPTINPPGGTFTGSILVSLQQTNAGATIYFTLDGSVPDTSSFLYTAPFNLTTSAVVRASAIAPSFINSMASRATFTIIAGPSFTGQAYLSNGVFTAQLSGVTNKTYVLQGSTDFINWIPVNTNVPASSPFLLADPQAGNYPYRFYRAVQQP
jgi:uncharacterized repeat protein (TIGR03806 family)